MRRQAIATALLAILLGGCGASHPHHSAASGDTRGTAASVADSPSVRARSAPPPQALVTDETGNRLLAVALPSGRVSRRVALPADPEDIATSGVGGVVVVVSSRASKVTVLARDTLRTIKTFGGFEQPHIAAISPDGQRAYVTDDMRGTLTVIRLSDAKITSTVAVGAGAHHLTFSPDQRRLWIALGESASQIVILDTSDPDRPHVVGRFSPGFLAHDLAFSPDGRQVWVSSATGTDVTVFRARDHRVLFRIGVGAAPQHLLLESHYAYLTSGYGRVIEKVDVSTGKVLRRAASPYGSFELAAADGYVVASSLLRGTLAIYTPGLNLLRVTALAPAAREVAISRP